MHTQEQFENDLIAATHDQRIQYLNALSDKVRAVREIVKDIESLKSFVDASSGVGRTWSAPSKSLFKADVETGEGGQEDNSLRLRAGELWQAFEDTP